MSYLLKTAYDRGALAALALFGFDKIGAVNPASAFKNMVRSGGAQVVESAATNPFKALGKGAVPAVQNASLHNPFARGFAQSRAVPGFGAAGQAPVQHGLQSLGGQLPPQAVATGALRPAGMQPAPGALAPRSPETEALRQRLLKAKPPVSG